MKKITIKEIAKEAGVSVGTVDRVLHDRGDVAEATRKLVLKIAKEGNYSTNVYARTLKLNKTFNLSVIIPQDNEYWLTLREGIEKAVQEFESLGLEVSYYKFERKNRETFIEQSNKAISVNPDGVIMAPLIEDEARTICRELNQREIPFVFVDSNLDDMSPLAFVGQNTTRSGYLSAKLLNYGFKEGRKSWILKYTDYDIWNKTVRERIEGFRKYYQENGWSDELIVEKELNSKASFESIFEHWNGNETLQIFVPNSRAYQIIDWLGQLNGDHEVRLVGYDQISQNIAALKNGQIDFIINQNPIQQGYLSVQSLYRHLIVNSKVEPDQYMPVEIVTQENVEYANVFYL